MEHFLNVHKDHPNQPEKSHKLYDETGHLVLSLMESQWKLRRQTWSEFPNGGKSIAEQILASKDRNKSKRTGLWESQSGIQVGKLNLWVRSLKNYNKVYQAYKFQPE